MTAGFDEVEKSVAHTPTKLSLEVTSSTASDVPLTSGSLADVVPPHESYEGYGHWDPSFVWTDEEERKVVRKTDFFLLSAMYEQTGLCIRPLIDPS